jgi:hypothetical protein
MIRIKPDGLSISAGHRLNLGLKPYPIAWSTSGTFGIKNGKKQNKKQFNWTKGGRRKKKKKIVRTRFHASFYYYTISAAD